MRDGVTATVRGLIAGTGTCAVGLAVLFSGGGVAAAASSPAATALAPISHPEADTMGSGIRAHEQAMQAQSSRTADAPGNQRRAYAVAEQTFGHDVSNWQPNINWQATAAAGAKFVYIKATESTTFRNPIFASQYIGAYSAGIIRGAYHFALPDRSSGTAQANFFVDNGGGWSPDGRTMPPMLDFEYNPYGPTCYGMTPSQLVSWVRDFSNTVHARTGRYPVIYTSAYYWNLCTGSNATFGSSNPLFIAYYPYSRNSSGSPGPMPAGWAFQSIWQYSDSGIFPGDADVFNGSMAQLRAFAGPPPSAPPTPPPPATTTAPGSPIDAYYAKLGGQSYLGAPQAAEYSVAGVSARDYQNGTNYYSAASGAHLVYGAILARYKALGGPAGVLKWPISDQELTPDRGGRYNTFSGMGRSSIYWTSKTGAHAVGGAIRAKWAALGGPLGFVGYPRTDELQATPVGGRYNSFTGADIYWTSATGAHEVHGQIRLVWNALGSATSSLGFPTTDEYSVRGGRRSDFTHGNVTWLASTGRATPTVT